MLFRFDGFCFDLVTLCLFCLFSFGVTLLFDFIAGCELVLVPCGLWFILAACIVCLTMFWFECGLTGYCGCLIVLFWFEFWCLLVRFSLTVVYSLVWFVLCLIGLDIAYCYYVVYVTVCCWIWLLMLIGVFMILWVFLVWILVGFVCGVCNCCLHSVLVVCSLWLVFG